VTSGSDGDPSGERASADQRGDVVDGEAAGTRAGAAADA
jgi:hypothetical protein